MLTHFMIRDYFYAEMVNWLKVRTKVSVESLSVRIFTQIFRG